MDRFNGHRIEMVVLANGDSPNDYRGTLNGQTWIYRRGPSLLLTRDAYNKIGQNIL